MNLLLLSLFIYFQIVVKREKETKKSELIIMVIENVLQTRLRTN